MDRKTPVDAVLSQIRSCLDAATSRPGLVKASVYQTEGYLIGIQGQAWRTPVVEPPSPEDPAALFLHDVRQGSVALRGRVKKGALAPVGLFLRGLHETFPESKDKPFTAALGKLWVRWSGFKKELSLDAGKRIGSLLKEEYEEGVAGDLSAYLLDDRIHLRRVCDYLRMRGWFQGVIEGLRRRSDWESREKAEILASNFSSVVLRALHAADVDYAAKTVAKLPLMIRNLDAAIERLAATEAEASHFLRKNRLTIITRALHSGYLDYPDEAARDLPTALNKLNARIRSLEASSPEDARKLRGSVASVLYRALTNGHLDSL